MLRVALLGTGGMMPLPNRKLTSMVANSNGSSILVDCGEGTQVALKMLGWGIKNIDVICITHFHPDHLLGLPGLLSTMGNSNRIEPVTIIGPFGLTKVMSALNVLIPNLPYEINLIEMCDNGIRNVKFKDLFLSAFKLEHSIECFGYQIQVKRSRKFLKEKAQELNIPVKYWSKLQKGDTVVVDGKTILPNMVLGNKRKGLKICYCTDTRPTKEIENFAKNSDLLICEGMYGEDSYIEKAILYKHMLFSEACKIAKNANVNELWLTHFSPSLINPGDFLDDAKKIFQNTKIGEELMTKEFKFNRDK